MLEKVDFGIEMLSKDTYKPIHDAQIEKLVTLQQRARNEDVGLVVLFEGWNGAGKGSRISDLIYNLDARSTSVYVTEDISRKEDKKFKQLNQGVSGYFPLMQEFWKALGEQGTITFYDRGWYIKTMQHMLFSLFGEDLGKKKSKARKKNLKIMEQRMETHLTSIESFERQLSDNGYTVLKLFLHITEEEQRERLTNLYQNPATRWRVSKEKLRRVKNYKQSYQIYDDLITETDYDFAPWTIINAQDKRRANLEIAAALIEAFELAFKHKDEKAAQEVLAKEVPAVAQTPSEAQSLKPKLLVSSYPQVKQTPSLDRVDRSLKLERDEYCDRLKYEQKRFSELELEMYLARVPLMVMFEGWDASGKGGAIKRLVQSLDARSYEIFPSPAPTPPEKLHPHLWRYWTRLPKAGHVGVYDRSWYGRVLVERVEGFAQEDEWMRSYDEINAFEQDMINWGAILIKFWVDVSQEEQLKRFNERQENPAKQWKITEEDWRNREKNPLYREAIEDMFKMTSTTRAPWTILESEDKYYARVKALQIVNDALTKRLH
ncbi:MAG: polyphosphate--AMP phosphotransferase [Raoultibacter sp.]|jgi:polyphosphate kinase 2 (PPK2 family)